MPGGALLKVSTIVALVTSYFTKEFCTRFRPEVKSTMSTSVTAQFYSFFCFFSRHSTFRIFMMVITSLFSCLFFSLLFARPINSQCTATEYMKTCSLQSNAVALQVFGEELLVGTANALLSYGLDLQQRLIVNLTSSEFDLITCADDNYSPESCKNFIKVIEPIPSSDKILVCGTNSYFPKCTLHNKNKLTNFTRLSNDNTEDIGYSPHSNNDFIISLVTSNKRFFSATRFTLNGALTTIGMSPNPLLGQNHFTVRVSASTNGKKLNLPIRYISAHEYGDYVYFFVTESALELVSKVNDMSSKQQYARAIRICKTDNGIRNQNPELNRFLTFQKARMECKIDDNGGFDYPYYYNHLKSTFVGYEEESPVLYGTFNSPSNGPKGGAICKFSFSGSLTDVFEDGNYYTRTMVSDRYVWTKETTQPFTCNGNRTTEDSNKYDLVYNPVSSGPLFVSQGEFLDKIAAETVTYDGHVQEVLFYSNHLGQVNQVVLSSAYPGESFKHTIIMDSDTNGNGDVEVIQKLILRNETDGARSLYVSRGRKIMQIYKGRCDRYVDCQDCLGSQDPYCAWKSVTASCVNKLTENSTANLTQSFSAKKPDIITVCMIPTGPPVDTDFPDLSPASNSGPTVISFGTPIVESLNPSLSTNKVSIFVVLGISVATFVAGLLMGLAVCFVFFCIKRLLSTRKSFDVHDSKVSSTRKSYEIHGCIAGASNGCIAGASNGCIAGASNATTSTNTEPVLVQSKKDDLNNNCDIKVSDKNPSLVKIDLSLKPTPPLRYVNHAVQSHQQAPQPIALNANPPANIKNGTIPTYGNLSTHVANGTVNPPANINNCQVSKQGNISTHTANGIVNPPVNNNSNISTHVAVGSSYTLPNHKHSNSKDVNTFNLDEKSEDCAFGDTVPPLKSFPSTNSMHDSLIRYKSGGGSNGITRKQIPKHKIPHGRTSSTIWLRESSVSSDVSSLESPISDV